MTPEIIAAYEEIINYTMQGVHSDGEISRAVSMDFGSYPKQVIVVVATGEARRQIMALLNHDWQALEAEKSGQSLEDN